MGNEASDKTIGLSVLSISSRAWWNYLSKSPIRIVSSRRPPRWAKARGAPRWAQPLLFSLFFFCLDWCYDLAYSVFSFCSRGIQLEEDDHLEEQQSCGAGLSGLGFSETTLRHKVFMELVSSSSSFLTPLSLSFCFPKTNLPLFRL